MSQKAKGVMKKQKRRHSFSARVAPVLLRLLAMMLVLGGSLSGAVWLWKYALADPRFLMDGETLAMAGAVRECPESIKGLEAIGRQFESRSLLDPLLLSDLEKSYGKNVWIKRVTRMRRHFPNRIELEFLIRMPVAQVLCNSRYWLIDKEAALLPVAGSKQPFPDLPAIVGATAGAISRHPAKAGELWQDAGVLGALGVMHAFWASPLAQVFPIERVVVVGGAYRDANAAVTRSIPRFEVVSPSGAVVRWGAYNEGDIPGELTSGEKLWQLQELLRREEADRPGVCFDVRTRLPGYSLL